MWSVALEGPEHIAEQAQALLVDENWGADDGAAAQADGHLFLR